VEEIVARRRACVAQQTLLQYHAFLSSLIQQGCDDLAACPPDKDCFSTRLDQLLSDLADVDRCLDSTDGWTCRDRDAVVAMASELSRGWFAGSTTLSVAGQRTVVPNVVDLCYQKLLLYSAATSPSVTQLSVFDVDQELSNTERSCDVEQPSPPGARWSSDSMLAETAGHVYRLIHGLEKCCSLDSPSCVLSGLVVYDRMCRLQQDGSPGAQQPARRPKVVQTNHGDTAPELAGTQKTAGDGEKDQSACKKLSSTDESVPDSG